MITEEQYKELMEIMLTHHIPLYKAFQRMGKGGVSIQPKYYELYCISGIMRRGWRNGRKEETVPHEIVIATENDFRSEYVFINPPRKKERLLNTEEIEFRARWQGYLDETKEKKKEYIAKNIDPEKYRIPDRNSSDI